MKKSKFVTMFSLLATSCASLLLSGCSSSEGKKQIFFYTCLGHNKATTVDNLVINKFNEDHKNTDQYKVIQKSVAGDYGSLHDTVKKNMSSGQTPSITMGYPDSFSEYIGSKGADKSQIINLQKFIDSDKNFKKEDFVDSFYEENTKYQYEGVWSLPMYKSTEVMYVNLDDFEATTFYKTNSNKTLNELTSTTNYPSDAKVGDPNTWDWDSLVYVAKQIQNEKNPDGSKDYYTLGYDSDSNLFITQMAARDIEYTTSEAGKIGKDHILFGSKNGSAVTINDDLINFAVELFDLTLNKTLATQSSLGTYSSTNYLNRKTMMNIGSTGGSAYNESIGKFRTGVYPVPTYKNKKKYIQQGPCLCFFPRGDSAKEKAVWDFYTNYLANPEYNAQIALDNSYDPVKKASFEQPAYKNWLKDGVDSTGKDDPTKELKFRIPNITSKLVNNYITTPVFNGSSKCREVLGTTLALTMGKDKNKSSKERVTLALTDVYNQIISDIPENA